MREYIYVLKLIPRLYEEKNWTEHDEGLVRQHFARLKGCCEDGKVITAGKTERDDDKGFGIVIFEEENDEKAEMFMNEDPVIKHGIMSGEVFSYRTALKRKEHNRK
ncbi:YciI family protein [Halobacillus halophilus]|uniref:YciI family protein n=1 Tax=Halobacillus halophilus TaxID=1570 RepID=UPI001CD58E1E|nr:YciI family protein [Halobacillus halophilus]MCA1011541.1 YciI family protein [Halobacillus halophilus]